MQLKHLSVVSFKNIRQLELEPAAKLTCLVGSNGEGKTNLLDAIYLLSMCKSSVGLTDRQCIYHGEGFFLLKGSYDVLGKEEVVSCGAAKADGKVMKRNGKAYEKFADHIGLLPLVMISPADSALISDSGEERRRYLNRILSQLDRGYLHAITRYNALLQQRNKALKANSSYDLIEVLDMQLTECARQVYDSRLQLVAQIQERFQKYYSLISEDKEQVSIGYDSDLEQGDFVELLKQSYDKDRALQYTSRGVHRDNLKMKIGDYPIRKIGSQGQQKTMLLALKLAQVDLLKQRMGIAPILLLDDIFDKLDLQRVQNLIHLVSVGNFGQIFLTDSNKVRVDTLLQEVSYEYKLFEVKGGEFAQL
ncbi:MAG: DNA replication and repair protein RecF [Prevotellaceae bacterium]|jgi:DNA replication and repair protein RecF|nr:DNA replication and repair protein RecF [Prevotellaceae bacterium]